LIVHDQVETPSTITLKSASAIAEIRTYPALSWVKEIGDRIPTLRRTDAISYKYIVHYARLAYGRLVGTMLKREGSADAVVGKLSRPGVPERLALTEKLGMHEEPDE